MPAGLKKPVRHFGRTFFKNFTLLSTNIQEDIYVYCFRI